MTVQRARRPDARAGRRARRGLALRHLRHRPAPRAREVRPPGQRARPRVGGHDRRARRPACTGWEIGARVVQNPTPGCGECRACKRGRPSVCLRREPPDLLDFTHGAFCRYKVVPAARLLRVPDSLSTRAAALTEPTAIAIHTVNLVGRATRRPRARHRRRPGRPADDRGAAQPGHRRHHRVRARAAAARARRSRSGASRGDRARAICRARRWVVRSTEPFTIAFECSGNAAAAESALDQLDYAGTLVFVGTGHDMPRINHNRAIVLELTIIGAYNYDVEGFAPGAGAARVGSAAARPADRADRHLPRRGARHDAPARGGRAARARSWSDRRSRA